MADGKVQFPDRPGDNRARRLMVVALMGLTWSYLAAGNVGNDPARCATSDVSFIC
jgi:hypothetical protein